METETQVELVPFVPFPEIKRLSRSMVVTEKIDGTNAQVCVLEDGRVLAGSRNRWITPEDDNFGFAKWVKLREEELRVGLGIGTHFGEWWGSGIQRGYGKLNGEKVFSLFNTSRWTDDRRPACCSVVPIILQFQFDVAKIDEILLDLQTNGSKAAPGFMNPEGVVIYHVASKTLFKKTLDKNDGHKSAP